MSTLTTALQSVSRPLQDPCLQHWLTSVRSGPLGIRHPCTQFAARNLLFLAHLQPSVSLCAATAVVRHSPANTLLNPTSNVFIPPGLYQVTIALYAFSTISTESSTCSVSLQTWGRVSGTFSTGFFPALQACGIRLYFG